MKSLPYADYPQTKRKGLRSEWGYGALIFLILLLLALLAIPKGADSMSLQSAEKTSSLVFPSQDLNGMGVTVWHFPVKKNVKVL